MIPNILIMGDLHGDFKPVRELRNRNPWLRGQDNILILLGDAGMNFYLNERDEEFKKKLSKYPFVYFVIRGNHEQRPSILANEHPDKWHTEILFDGLVWVENKYPYIKYAMDYVSTYLIPYDIDYFSPENPEDDDIEVVKYLHTLVIPGAYSVDKFHRLKAGWSWFPEEQLSEKEMNDGLEILNVINWKCDLVLSHTCPIIYEPTDLYIPTLDQSTVDKTMERYLGQIEYRLDYKAWCFGHYHQFRDYPRTDGRFRTMLFNDYAINLKDYIAGEIEKI